MLVILLSSIRSFGNAFFIPTSSSLPSLSLRYITTTIWNYHHTPNTMQQKPQQSHNINLHHYHHHQQSKNSDPQDQPSSPNNNNHSQVSQKHYQQKITTQQAKRLPSPSPSTSTTPQNVAIIGGGLAGLSTTYYLLKRNVNLNITIIDQTLPGQGGASSVAGGLLHPFSPRGKLIHLGNEGLQSTNELIQAAIQYQPSCVLRNQLYRIALNEKNVQELQLTSTLHPQYATWLSSQEIKEQCGYSSSSYGMEGFDSNPHSDLESDSLPSPSSSSSSSSSSYLGGIVMSNGCKVIHVPTYLEGLWNACQELSSSSSSGTITWSVEGNGSDIGQFDWKNRLKEFDTTIFAAGSGLFHDKILSNNQEYDDNCCNLPIELVRGQSIEMIIHDSLSLSHTRNRYPIEALLCGKYVVPMPQDNRVLIGATHEFQSDPFDKAKVLEELKERSYNLAPRVWDEGIYDKITVGYRVQSKRGKYGRMPIIGQLNHHLSLSVVQDRIHDNAWIFTGLSSRGLIYHGVYGKLLSSAIMEGDENILLNDYPDLYWWK